MIDRIKIYKEIDLDVTKFSNKFKYYYKEVPQEIDYETGEILKDRKVIENYSYKNNGLSIKYSISTKRLWIEGRLPNIATTRNLVHNLDDFLLGQEKLVKYEIEQEELDSQTLCNQAEYDADDNLVFPDQWIEEEHKEYVYDNIDSILDKTNSKIYELIGEKLDIAEFDISNIEVTFNIFDVEHVGKYIELFNLIFKDKKDKRYKNYTLETDKLLYTSFYVKTNSNYTKNTNDSYTVNFYNKLNQLEYLEKNPRNNTNVTLTDKILAENVLRLEVKLGYKELKKTTKKFKQFLDIDFCAKILINKYRYFISKDETLDFYSYKKAKQIIKDTDKLVKQDKTNLLNHIEKKYKCNKKFKYQTESKYKKLLAKLGIHYYFIPTKWGIDFLESPISMLNDKVEFIKDKIVYF
ncbi:MAG: hypothetical protein ACRC3Y_10620 [Romboutsia sp.]|uniref:hypothetical protein n=1 Tax=Romboutsia sp. TaxID=1965302 RepID=UPI003F37ADD0